MRISDWSSDVCSSDLNRREGSRRVRKGRLADGWSRDARCLINEAASAADHDAMAVCRRAQGVFVGVHVCGADRKSGVWGKSVSVRVALGGRRSIQKKNTNTIQDR